jgi:hypothetical protein
MARFSHTSRSKFYEANFPPRSRREFHNETFHNFIEHCGSSLWLHQFQHSFINSLQTAIHSGATVHSRAFVWETPQECEVPKITALGGTLGYFGYSQVLPTPRELPYTKVPSWPCSQIAT